VRPLREAILSEFRAALRLLSLRYQTKCEFSYHYKLNPEELEPLLLDCSLGDKLLAFIQRIGPSRLPLALDISYYKYLKNTFFCNEIFCFRN